MVAFAELPLADAYAVLFTVPLLVTALSVPLLGERIGPRGWAAVAVGFAGVLAMVRPGGSVAGHGAVAAGSAALFGALAVMAVRRLQATETTEACATYGNLAVVLGTGAALPWVFVLPAAADLALSAAAGVLGACSMLLSLCAYRLAPASVLAPLQYSQMPYALLLGWLVFNTRPEPATLAGAAVVVASGLCVLRRQPGAVSRAAGTRSS
jgi:drug/metabolite transporter (DMT)-like permease